MIQSGTVTRGDKLMANGAGLAELVASFPADSLLSQLGDHEFCVAEHVCHLRDVERDGFTPRIHSVIDEDDPLLFGFDGAGVAAASDYRSENTLDALNAFLEARRENTAAVRDVAEADFARVGHYEGGPPITLDAIVAGMLDHDRDHLDRLRPMLARAEAARG
jgi:hypothetical protein